jgi:hypothetical protein
LGRRQSNHPARRLGPEKRPLSNQAQSVAIAIPPQDFDPIPASVPKHEHLAGKRIGIQLVASPSKLSQSR